MDYIAQKIVQGWILKEYISAEDEEICLYNLQCWMISCICFLSIAMMGGLLGRLLDTMLLMMGIVYLRKCTNGYHASSQRVCFFISILVTLLSLMVVPLLDRGTASILSVISLFIICRKAPINNSQIHLSPDEMIFMRSCVKKRIAVLTIAYIALLFLDEGKAYCLTMSITVVACSLLLSRYGIE